MAAWPEQTEVEQWLSSQSISPETIGDRLPFAYEAALEVVKDDVDENLFPGVTVDADGEFVIPDPVVVPESVRLAVMLVAHRLLTRADSPTGVIGFGEFAIRVGRDDPDYRILIRRYVAPQVA